MDDEELDDFFLGAIERTHPKPKPPIVSTLPKHQANGVDVDLAEFLRDEPEPLPAPPPDDEARMPNILIRSLNASLTAGWTYNPRSDRHSNLKCLGMLFDLMRMSPRLTERLRARELVFGVNTRAYGKTLDLVIGEPAIWEPTTSPRTLEQMVEQFGVELALDELAAFGNVADICEGLIASPCLVVEAKSVMTDHAGALPRLSDELERFRMRVQEVAIAVGLVLVNTAEQFVSPGQNGYDPGRPELVVNEHHQPSDAERVISMVAGLPRRTHRQEPGFDALGMVFTHCQNDGSPMTLKQLGPDDLAYSSMIRQVVKLL